MRKAEGWKGEKGMMGEMSGGNEEVRALCPQRESWKRARDKPTLPASRTLSATAEKMV